MPGTAFWHEKQNKVPGILFLKENNDAKNKKRIDPDAVPRDPADDLAGYSISNLRRR